MNTSFEKAFLWSLSYNGFESDLNALIEYLKIEASKNVPWDMLRKPVVIRFPSNQDFLPKRDVENNQPMAILWSVLCQMFGRHSVSPNHGYILNAKECIEYLQDLRYKTYVCKYYSDNDMYIYVYGSRAEFEAFCAKDGQKRIKH